MEALNPLQFITNKIQDFWNFVLHNCIVIFESKQVYLGLEVTNFKIKEVTANS